MIKYDSYKDSGVEWIGDIPKHWGLISIKNLVSTKITDGPHESPNFLDEGVPFLSVESVQDNKLDFNKKRGYISREQHEIYSLKCKPQRDDVFIVKSGSTTGKSTIVETDEEFNIWSPLCIVRSNKNKIIPRFLFSSIQSFYFRRFVELGWSFGTQPNIGMGVIENIKLVVPPIQEQNHIIQYLDTKTNLIDTLIQKTQEKINLLRVKRTSLINHTVTKGLNPHVDKKDSGVEWIGEVPEHWKLVKLKTQFRIVKIISGTLGYDVLSVTQRGLKVKDLSSNEGQHSMDYSKYQIVKKGQFVMNHMDLLTGFVDISRFEGVTSPDYRVFELTNSLNSDSYYLYIFQLCYWTRIFYGLGSGVSNLGRWRLPSDEFKEFRIPLPPIMEQHQIVQFLDNQTHLTDTLVEKEERRIQLLKEYRQSLISDVVTGKIKVTKHE